MPHGHCYYWQPEIVWTHVVSDLVIGLSYYSIPLMILYFVRRRKDIPFHWLFVLFAGFIFWCGTTHFLSILTLWVPVYRLDGVVKAITAAISLYTAIILFPIIPQALNLKTTKGLEELNLKLQQEIEENKRIQDVLRKSEEKLLLVIDEKNEADAALKSAHDQLETRVQERTEEVAQINQELFRSNADLQQFAYVASHDLQEPLRTITVYLELLELENKSKLDSEALDNLHFAVDAATRMSLLIDGLLTFSRMEKRDTEKKSISLHNVLASAVRNLESVVNKTGAVVTHGKLPTLVADEIQMIQLFQNLLSNAFKFQKENKPEVHVDAVRKDGEWLISMSDNGIGIDAKYVERIFTVFKRLHSREEFPGTGIGLAVCKKIVERYGGKIWVESELGKGSIFYFTLKTADELRA